jgi:DNA topoisomerase-2
MSKITKKQVYTKMDPVDHILARSDMYISSTKPRKVQEYIATSDTNGYHIYQNEIMCSPGLLRIFVEPLSNAVDNVSRSIKGKTPCTNIKVNIDLKTGKTSVWNDGMSIEIEMNEEEKCYNHTMIFGQLLTSSNYDDGEERVDISGRNGLGVKLCNVFSESFSILGYDPKSEQTFEQTWTNNMKTVSDTIITKTKKYKTGFTQVTWTPDFKRFGVKGYTQDIINLYCRYVIDAAMITKVNVYFNNELVPVKSISDYAELYLKEPTQEILIIKTPTAEIALTPSCGDYQTISFASGVYTCNGGTHVDAWSESIFRPIVNKFNAPKKPQITIKDVKQFFRLFVVASVTNPTFDSQDKSKLESPTVIASVKPTHINTIMKWSIREKIEDIIRSKEMITLKKTERKKKGFIKIEGLDPANNAGTKHATECTLILCEGLSAKTYAVQGIEIGVFGKQGRDWFGILPLRGKLLNVRNNKPDTISKNAVVNDLIKSIGARYGVDYTDEKNFKTLQYGSLMILTDADDDGIHISGLIQNIIHNLFPSLLCRETPFITSMHTPIVRVYLSRTNSILFYDESEYRMYVEKYQKRFPNKIINKKYYKGLGTSSEEDILETFGKKMLLLKGDEKITDSMNKVFHKNYADSRKEWLENYSPENPRLSWSGSKEEVLTMDMSKFLDTELIKFSLSDCKRSIPNAIDGLKESNRKILYSCFLKNLRYTGKTLKVAQLAGYVAEKSAYHHGEQNNYKTITKMAHAFPGSNNIPLLYRDGQFGSRMEGGEDAANARYIFTKLDKLTRLLFKVEDDALYERVEDDGDVVEPKQYIPILPMILVNGCSAGIGTGWSSSVPCYNPLDLIAGIKIWLANDGKVLSEKEGMLISMFPEMTPWYRGFTGRIEKDTKDNRYITYGRVVQESKKRIVEELPVGLWTNKFKETLDGHLEDKQIQRVQNYSTPKVVKFVITESQDGFVCNEKTLKLHTYLYTSNMVLFTTDGKLKKFKSTDEILDYFCKVRYSYYIKRKKHILDKYKTEITFLGNKKRFLEEVMNGDLSLYDNKKSREEEDIINDLIERKYDKETKTEVNEEGETVNVGGYDYLLRMQIRSFTTKKLNSLKNDIDSVTKKIEDVNKTSETDMWLIELEEFAKAYTSWLKEIDKETIKTKNAKK